MSSRRATELVPIVVLSLVCLSTCSAAALPELFERVVLPVTSAPPSSACVVRTSRGQPDYLIVGLSDGRVVQFAKSGQYVLANTVPTGLDAPVDALCVYDRPGRTRIILASQERTLSAISFERSRVLGRARLPQRHGTWRLEVVSSRGNDTPATDGSEDAVFLYDDRTLWRVGLYTDADGFAADLACIISDKRGIAVSHLSGMLAAATPDTVLLVGPETSRGYGHTGSLVPSPGCFNPGRAEPRIWFLRGGQEHGIELPFGGRISAALSLGDSLLVVGGSLALVPEYQVGRLLLLAGDGRIRAQTTHPSPVAILASVDEYVAVQGDGRNLSIYDRNLNPLWEHNSPVRAAVLVAGDFDGNGSDDVAVVGSREFSLRKSHVDTLRYYLNDPSIMADAHLARGLPGFSEARYVATRPFISLFLSHKGELESLMAAALERADDLLSSGDYDGARSELETARGAAATLGLRDKVADLTERIADCRSRPLRRKTGVFTWIMLAGLGCILARARARERPDRALATTLAFSLLALGAVARLTLGPVVWTPLLFLGGAVALSFPAGLRLADRTGLVTVRRSGAAIEELVYILAQFGHGTRRTEHEDRDGVQPRQAITALSYLAQEMLDSAEEPERFAKLHERFAKRADAFRDVPTLTRRLVSLSHRCGFLEEETQAMASAAATIRQAITHILESPERDPVRSAKWLRAVPEAREELVAAFDRAWAQVEANPGCSLNLAIDAALEEASDRLREAGVTVERGRRLPDANDAVALWSYDLKFILENLVANATRAMLSSGHRKLTFECESSGRGICELRVSDTGSGIPTSKMPTLFNMNTDWRNGGLGLPRSRDILRARGGDILVEETAEGEGTTFLLLMPHWRPNPTEDQP